MDDSANAADAARKTVNAYTTGPVIQGQILLPEEVHISFVQHDDADRSDWDAFLTADERERRETFLSARRRLTYTMGRVAARGLLSQRVGMPPHLVPLQIADDGSIDVDGHPVFLSITHTAYRAAAAVAPYPLGIDMEPVDVRAAELFRYVLHPDEYALLEKSPLNADHTTLLFWTLKEAVLKGQRTGLRSSPKDLRLEVDLERGVGVVRNVNGEVWSVQFAEQGDHFISLAFKR